MCQKAEGRKTFLQDPFQFLETRNGKSAFVIKRKYLKVSEIQTSRLCSNLPQLISGILSITMGA